MYSRCRFAILQRTVATGMKDSTVAVWDLRACRMAWSVKAHDNERRSVEYSADGRFFISGSFDSTVSIIDMDVWERRVVARVR